MFCFATIRLFWCVATSSPTLSVMFPLSAKIRPVPEDARRVEVVAARLPRVALGEDRRPVHHEVEVFVVLARLADGDPDVAVDRVRENEADVGVDLGEVDALRRLERDDVVRGAEARIRGRERGIGALGEARARARRVGAA